MIKDIKDKILNIKDEKLRAFLLDKGIKELLSQINGLKANHPYKKEEEEFIARFVLDLSNEDIIKEDVKIFNHFNPNQSMEFIKESLKDKDIKDLRKFTLKFWEDILAHKKINT